MPNARRLARQLDELYARLPAIDCAGLCDDSCGPVPAAPGEDQRIARVAGRPPRASARGCADCSLLDQNRRCSAYDVRPLICRLWGTTDSLRCPYGCQPDRRLTDLEALELVIELYDLAGWPPGSQPITARDARAVLDGPDRAVARRAVRSIVGGATLAARPRGLHPFDR